MIVLSAAIGMGLIEAETKGSASWFISSGTSRQRIIANYGRSPNKGCNVRPRRTRRSIGEGEAIEVLLGQCWISCLLFQKIL
jgi:hypothetical protein